MKRFAKIFALIIALVGLASCNIIGGQQNQPVEPYNALGNFVDGGDGIYSIDTNSADELTFSYEKASEENAYSYLYTEIAEGTDLSKYKRLIVNVSGNGTMLLKLESSEGAREISLNVTANPFTYDWSVMDDAEFLKTVTKVVIIAHPGKAEGVGYITVSKLTFDEAVAGSDGQYIISSGYNNIPSNVNEYNGKDATFNFNAKWENANDETVYEIEQDETTKEVSVRYNKQAGNEWSCIQSQVKGDLSKFKYVVFVMTGIENNPVMLKAEGVKAAEKTFKFTGEKDTFVLDISTFSDAEKSGIAKVVVFGHPNAVQNGRFTIHEAYMSEESPIEMEEIIVNEYDGTSETFEISNHWYDGGDSVYEVSKQADGVHVSFSKNNNQTYSTLKAYVRNMNAKFNFLVAEISGAEGTSVMLKAGDSFESQIVVMDGTVKQLVVVISNMNTEQKQNLTEAIIFGNPGSGGQGEFTIHNVYYAEEVEGVELPSVNVYEGQKEFDINNYWNNNVADYTVNEEQWVTTINWNKTDTWAAFFTNVEGVTNEFNYLMFKVRGTAGQKIIVKPSNGAAVDNVITLTETDTMYYIPVPENMNRLDVIGNFEYTAETAQGYCVISEAKLIKAVADATVDFAPEFVDGGDNVYTNENGLFSVNKTSQGWASIYTHINPISCADYKLVLKLNVLEYTGVEKLSVFVNINNPTVKELQLEEGTYEYELDPTEDVNLLRLFIGAGQENMSAKVDVEVVAVPKGIQMEGETLNVAYTDCSGDNMYSFVEGSETVVNYDVKGSWYYFQIDPADGVVTDCEKVQILIDGQVEILVKPNNNGTLEKRVTLDGEQLLEFTINGDLASILIFVAPEQVAQGSLTIKKITYVGNKATENIYVSGNVFNVNHFWNGDATEYTFTEADGKTIVEYHTTGGWKFFACPMSGVTTEFNHVKLVVKADKDVLFTVKPNDVSSYEKHLNLKAGEVQEFFLPIPANMTKIIAFLAGDQEGGSTGTVEFQVVELVNVYGANDNIAAAFKDCGDNVYTVTAGEGNATVAYHKTGQQWAAMYVNLLPFTSKDHKLVVTVKGVAGVQCLVKLNDDNAYQTTIQMSGDLDTVVIENAPAVVRTIHVFFAPGDTSEVQGTAELAIAIEEKEVDNTPVSYSLISNGNDAYSISGDINEGNVQVAYTKYSDWDNMKLTPSKAVQVTAIRFVVKSEDTAKFLIKPNDNGGLQKELDLTAEGTVFEWTFDTPTDLSSIFFFAAPGQTGPTGTVTIVSMELTVAE